MILLIDNYDSFTYNVCQGIGELYENIEVVRNDEITVEEMAQREIEALIISDIRNLRVFQRRQSDIL